MLKISKNITKENDLLPNKHQRQLSFSAVILEFTSFAVLKISLFTTTQISKQNFQLL